MFILKNVMDKADTMMKLLKVDVKNENIYETFDTVDVGMWVYLHVSYHKKSFRNGVRIVMSIVV